MCEQCRYAQLDVIRDILARARPEQIRALLRDLNRLPPPGDSGGEPI